MLKLIFFFLLKNIYFFVFPLWFNRIKMGCNAQNYSVFLFIMPKDTKICSFSYVFFLLSLVLKCGGLYGVFPSKRYCIECSIRGAGPDPRVNPADEVKQKAARGSPALRGLRGGMLLILQTKRARPQPSPIYRP